MTYKGYDAHVAFDYDREVFYGKILHIEDLVTFEATTVDALRREFEASVDDYLEFCEEEGKTPDRPYSGNFVLRGTPQIHKGIATIASRTGESMNAVAVRALQTLIDKELHGKVEPTVRHVTEQLLHIGPVQVLQPYAMAMAPMLGDVGTLLGGTVVNLGPSVPGTGAPSGGIADPQHQPSRLKNGTLYG